MFSEQFKLSVTVEPISVLRSGQLKYNAMDTWSIQQLSDLHLDGIKCTIYTVQIYIFISFSDVGIIILLIANSILKNWDEKYSKFWKT